MGFKQTAKHRFGKSSYHQVGLVRGQFGNVAMDKWVPFLQQVGFDGWVSVHSEYQGGHSLKDMTVPEVVEQTRADLAYLRKAVPGANVPTPT